MLEGDDRPTDDGGFSEEFSKELQRRQERGDDVLPTGEAEQFNSELYDELNKRPEFYNKELYDNLRKRADVDQSWYSSFKERATPNQIIPQQGQTPGQVIEYVLRALQNNEEPYKDSGVEMVMNFSSTASAMHPSKMTTEMVSKYFVSSKYKILLEWDQVMYSKPLDLSYNGKRAYQQLRHDFLQSLSHLKSAFLSAPLQLAINMWL